MDKQDRHLGHSASKYGGDALDKLHKAALSGKGLVQLMRIMPTADPTELRWWAETNGYTIAAGVYKKDKA